MRSTTGRRRALGGWIVLTAVWLAGTTSLPAQDSEKPDEKAQPPAAPRRQAPPEPEPDIFRPREVPENLDTSLHRASDGGHFRVSIRSIDRVRELNRIHNWTVTVRNRRGTTVDDAKITVSGGMPAHDHDFPTAPRVTRRIVPGTYLIEGVKFNMTGWWQFEFEIRVGKITDRVRFNVVVKD